MSYENKITIDHTHKSPSEWTRADLLLALYDRTIETMQQLIDAVKSDSNTAAKYQTRAVFLLEQIIAGIDWKVSAAAQGISSVCEYALRGVEHCDPSMLAAARLALTEIRDGFQSVRNDADRMEKNGEISKVNLAVETEA